MNNKHLGINKEYEGLQELIDGMKLHAGSGYYITYDLKVDYERLLIEEQTHNFWLWCIRRNGTHLFNLEKTAERNSELIPTLKEDKDNRFFEIKKLDNMWYLTPQQFDLSQADCQDCLYWLADNPRPCYECRARNNFSDAICCEKCNKDYATKWPNTNSYICDSCEFSAFEQLAGYLTQGECEFTHQFTDYKIVIEGEDYNLYIKQNDINEFIFVDVTDLTAKEVFELVEAFNQEYPGALNFYKLKQADKRNLLKKFDC